jgi:hypothetical protein
VAAGFGAVAVGDGEQFARFVDGVELGAEAVVFTDGPAAEGAAVDAEFDFVGVAVDLDRDRGPLEAGPGPARDGVAPRPRAADEGLPVMLWPLDGQVGLGAQAEDDLAVVGGGPPMAGDVDVAAIGQQVRVRRGVAGSRTVRCGVLRTADAGLAEVVPAGPGEVPDDVAVLLDQPPEIGDAGARTRRSRSSWLPRRPSRC